MEALGINARNLLGIAPRNHAKGMGLARDKVAAKVLLAKGGVPVPHTRCVVEDMWGLAALSPHLEGECVMKPASGSGGGGILILKKEGEGFVGPSGRRLSLEEVQRHAAAILHGGFAFGGVDRVLVEDRLRLHPAVVGLHPAGISDVRVIFIDGQWAMSMLRMPTVLSEGKANLHQGGVAAPVDHAGRLGLVFDGRHHTPQHPDGQRVAGCVLPDWDRVVAVSTRTATLFPLDYIGIDLVLTEDGPVVLEVNARPGLAIQNVNRISLKPWL